MSDYPNDGYKRQKSKEKEKPKQQGTLARMMGTLRPSANKARAPLAYTHSDNPPSNSRKGNQLNTSHDSSSTFYKVPESVPITSTNIIDVNSLTDEEVRERFKSVMDDKFERNETKKQTLQHFAPEVMRKMLITHYILENEEMTGEKSPEFQIDYLNSITTDNVTTKNTKQTFERIAFSLKKYGLKWSKVFGENLNGPNAMLKAMRACISKIQITREKFIQDGDERKEKQNLLHEILGAGIEAFKNYFNLGWNFNSMKETLAKNIAEITIDVLNILSFDNDERSIKIKSSCAILLFALAMPNENHASNGQNIVELLSQSAKKWSPNRERFHCLVRQLDGSIEVASSFLMCINGIFYTLSTEQRYHLRTELFRSGFKTSFEELQRRREDCEDAKQAENLSTQIDLFLRHIEADYQEMNIKLDRIQQKWADLQACFDCLRSSVEGTPSESLLLTIISRLICIRDDPAIRYSYLRLIDECITRIVFSKTGCDPDFDTYSMDSESMGDSGLILNDNQSSIRNGSTQDLRQMTESAEKNVTAIENEIQVNLMKGRVEHLEHTREKLTKALENILTQVDQETAKTLKRQYSDILGEPAQHLGSSANISTSMENTAPPPPPPPPPPFLNIPMPPNLPPGLIPQAPPMAPPPPPGMIGNGIPPPPPPPGMFGNGIPPPPPPPGMFGNGIPPPPPGMMGPGGVPPPPMMNMNASLLGPPPLPEYLPTKQKYVVGEPVKKVAWNKVNPQTIKKDSIWANIDEKHYQNKTFFNSIKENFTTKVAPTRVPVESDNESSSSTATTTTTTNTAPIRKAKEFRVLDPRAGQNFAIMFSKLKCTPQQFRQWILTCDSEHLTGDLLGQLNKSLPNPDEMKKLADLKNEINDLPDSEQYFCAISDIKRVHQRIRILLFRSEYKELLEQTEKYLVAGHQACETVRRSKRFPKLIELILTIGNYMNSSGKDYQPIYGFDISFLPKLHSTKANDGKRTLLHFILQQIENDDADLLKFGDEFQGVAEVASKIDITELQRTLTTIKSRVTSAQTDLDSAKNNPTDSEPDDRFVEAMEGFVKAARDDTERLDALNVKMTNAYQELCDYLAMDSKKCSLTDFFTDLKAFCTLFLTCLQENRLWREQDEKTKRVQTSKQLVDDIRKKQRAESKVETKPFFKPNDEDTDVVSNLMSVLKDANMSAPPRRFRRPPEAATFDGVLNELNTNQKHQPPPPSIPHGDARHRPPSSFIAKTQPMHHRPAPPIPKRNFPT